jgi:hypothetical protein
MQIRFTVPTVSAVVLIASLACSNPAGPDEVQITGRVTALIEALRQQGATVRAMERMSADAHCLSLGAQRLVVNGENVYAFEYETAEAATRDASTVSSDGSTITATGRACMPGWTAPPRFYRQDRLMALYVGTNQDLIRTLDGVLGSPFAHR